MKRYFIRLVIYVLIFLVGIAAGGFILSKNTFSIGEAIEQIELMNELNETLREFYEEVDRAWRGK